MILHVLPDSRTPNGIPHTEDLILPVLPVNRTPNGIPHTEDMILPSDSRMQNVIPHTEDVRLSSDSYTPNVNPNDEDIILPNIYIYNHSLPLKMLYQHLTLFFVQVNVLSVCLYDLLLFSFYSF